MIKTQSKINALNKNNEVIEAIKEGVAIYFGVDYQYMHTLKQTRKDINVKLKQHTVYICKVLAPKLTMEFIGKRLGGFDHSTMVHSYIRACDLMQTNPKFKSQMDELINIFISGGEHKDDFKRILSEMYFYINLDNIKVFRLSSDSSIVFSGVNDNIINRIKKEYFPTDGIVIEELKDTGMSIMGKKSKLLTKAET